MNALRLALVLQLQIPSPVGFVNDFAGIIDPETQRAMLTQIEEVRAKCRGEIVAVTLTDLEGRASIDVARDIGRTWRVGALGQPGDAARNAGVVLLLKPGQRPGDGQADLAIATGTGAEGFITDARAGRIRDAIGRASVERGSYAAGLAVGVRLLAEAYAEEFGFALTGSRPQAQAPAGGGQPPAMVLFAVALMVLMLAVIAARAGRGRRRRGSLAEALLWGAILGGGRRGRSRGGWSGWSGGGGSGGGGGFGGFGGGGGFSGGGASGKF